MLHNNMLVSDGSIVMSQGKLKLMPFRLVNVSGSFHEVTYMLLLAYGGYQRIPE